MTYHLDQWLGHPIKALFLFCLTILAVTLTAKEAIRTWTSADGRTLQAEYISSSAGKVTIKMGSREYTLPLSRFSPADQQYVAELASKPAPAITQAESRDARTYAKEEKDWEGYLKGGAIVVDFSGDVEVKAPAPPDLIEKQYAPTWEDPKKEQILTAGYALRTREGSNIRLLLTNGTLVTLSPVSEAKILTFFQESIAPSNRTFKETTEELSPSMVKLELSLGEMIVETKKLDKGSTFDIYGPVAAAGIRGTAFRLRASEGEQALEVLRGQVDCQQGGGPITSVIGGQANSASRGRIEDPVSLSDNAGEVIEQNLSLLRKQVGGLTIIEMAKMYDKSNPPFQITVKEDGFEAELRRKIRRPKGKILESDFARISKISAHALQSGAILQNLDLVQKCENLVSLVWQSQRISDLSPLANLQKLENLEIHSGSPLKSLKPITRLKELRNLAICTGFDESEIKQLSYLKKLEVLQLYSNKNFIKDISKISSLRKLELRIGPNSNVLDPNDLRHLRNLQLLKEVEFLIRNRNSPYSESDLMKFKKTLPNVEFSNVEFSIGGHKPK